MRILIKIGGSLLDDLEPRRRIAAELTAASHNHEAVVVHGGGKQMTRFLTERGVESRFVEGLRVSSPEVIDAVLKVFAGTVNHQLVAALVEAGADAVGLTGIDALIAEAEQLRPDLGAVGKITNARADLLHLLVHEGYLPVVACVAGDRQGRVFNVNADQMAVACAIAYGAERLIFLTDVDGVKGADGGVLPRLTVADARRLIESGVATGGMQAKLNAAAEAVQQGVGEVVIAAGASAGMLDRLLGGEAVGSRLVKE